MSRTSARGGGGSLRRRLRLVRGWSGSVFELTDAEAAASAAFVVAIVAGGATFVPGAVRGLARGRLGVGLLMSIALVGAVVLGQFGEAASLAFLFSISEALEEWAVPALVAGCGRCCRWCPTRHGCDVVQHGRDRVGRAAGR